MVPFWVQAHGVPLEALNAKAATKIGVRIGGLMEVEDPSVDGQMLRSFLRMRIMIDIQKPLTTGFWVPRRNKGNVWVWLRYERLQNYCYNCGKIGHESKNCKESTSMSLWNPKQPRYGPGLGVPMAKSLEVIRRENANRKMKSHGLEVRDEERGSPDENQARGKSPEETNQDNNDNSDAGYKVDLAADNSVLNVGKNSTEIKVGSSTRRDPPCNKTKDKKVLVSDREIQLTLGSTQPARHIDPFPNAVTTNKKEGTRPKCGSHQTQVGQEVQLNEQQSIIKEKQRCNTRTTIGLTNQYQTPGESAPKVNMPSTNISIEPCTHYKVQQVTSQKGIGQWKRPGESTELKKDTTGGTSIEHRYNSQGSCYFVQLPEEEEGSWECAENLDKGAIDSVLASGLARVLNLKRGREKREILLLGNGEELLEEEEGRTKRRKEQNNPSRNGGDQSISFMAEEAGLNMPPPQP